MNNPFEAIETTLTTLVLLDFSPRPAIRGLQTPIAVGSQHDISCSVDHFRTENVTFRWTLGNKECPGKVIKPLTHKNNSATSSSLLGYNFGRSDDQMNIMCWVTLDNDMHGSSELVTSAKINLFCKYHGHLKLAHDKERTILDSNIAVICISVIISENYYH